MTTYFAPRAQLADGWHSHVTLEVSDAGFITRVTPDSAPGAAIPLAGAVIPAMTNLHSHAFQRAMAGLAEVAGDPQDSFWTWRELMYRMVARLTPQQLAELIRKAQTGLPMVCKETEENEE